MTDRKLGYHDGALVEQWDDATRIYTDFRTDPDTTMTYAEKSVADGWTPNFYDDRADADAIMAQASTNQSALSDPATLLGRLQRLDAYNTDPEVVAALARANATAMTTQELNRLVKVILRRQARITSALVLAIRLLHPDLLADISDTVEV